MDWFSHDILEKADLHVCDWWDESLIHHFMRHTVNRTYLRKARPDCIPLSLQSIDEDESVTIGIKEDQQTTR